uniref:Uncharacterized protein n=1 Tax=Anopheles merus TaxID=30066 RepID=A0A182UVJ9_ANOME
MEEMDEIPSKFITSLLSVSEYRLFFSCPSASCCLSASSASLLDADDEDDDAEEECAEEDADEEATRDEQQDTEEAEESGDVAGVDATCCGEVGTEDDVAAAEDVFTSDEIEEVDGGVRSGFRSLVRDTVTDGIEVELSASGEDTRSAIPVISDIQRVEKIADLLISIGEHVIPALLDGLAEQFYIAAVNSGVCFLLVFTYARNVVQMRLKNPATTIWFLGLTSEKFTVCTIGQ